MSYIFYRLICNCFIYIYLTVVNGVDNLATYFRLFLGFTLLARLFELVIAIGIV
jgi:hypothetical protein